MISGSRDTVKLARKLRSEMTLPERALWSELRKRPGGYKFRRQHPAGPFVLDFYCASSRLAIEVDGQAHDMSDRIKRDQRRLLWLRKRGIATTRIPARLVLEDIEPVVIRLLEICDARKGCLKLESCPPLHQPSVGPPPQKGED